MELSELVRIKRCTPQRTWNIASSEHWYKGDDFWLDMISRDPIYKCAMIDTEAKLIDTICNDILGEPRKGIFIALGPGDHQKESKLHATLGTEIYVPIDINKTDLELAAKSVAGEIRPIHAEFREGLRMAKNETSKFMYLGATYSNLDAMDYDLLAAIDESMNPGDTAYVSVQTFPNVANTPLLMHQYHNAQFLQLNKRMANAIGAAVDKTFVQFNVVTRNVEIGSIISTVSGTAREVGMQSGDKIVSLISHKPEALLPELTSRFENRYAMKSYQVQQEVPTPSATYISTFEGVLMTKR